MRVAQVNNRQCPIIDTELQEFLSSKELDLTATTDLATASSNAEIVIVATPTDYDPKSNFFDTSSVEGVVQKVTEIAPDATIIIKSTIPVGFVRKRETRIAYSAQNSFGRAEHYTTISTRAVSLSEMRVRVRRYLQSFFKTEH